MVTVSYGLHRKKSEILVAEMMEELAKQPYENIDFLNLKGKSRRYLGNRTNGFVFDVHGGEQEKEILNMKFQFPASSFILYSNVTEKKYLEFLKKYRAGSILLVHKDENLVFNNLWWTKGILESEHSFDEALEYVRRCNLENRLIVIELLNASEKIVIEVCHKPFMKRFLTDLDSFS